MRSYRSVEIFFFLPLIFPPFRSSSFFYFDSGGKNGRGGNGKVKSLDWQALAFRLRRVRMIQYQVSHQTDKEKNIQVLRSLQTIPSETTCHDAISL